MKAFFSKGVSLKSSHLLSKADKRRIGEQVGAPLDPKREYTISTLSNRAQLVKLGAEPLYFKYFDTFFPTICNFDRARYKCVTLNDLAVGPLRNGADVMAPGILLFEERCPDFEKDEVLGVEIIDRGVFAVGVALVSSREMRAARRGPVVQVLHIQGDELDSRVF